ncbi:MAG: hypothetical protein ACE5J2_02005 [Nitrososphaerales archaeon]
MINPVQKAKEIIEDRIKAVRSGSVELRNGCVACHTIFTLADRLGTNEADAADLLTQVLAQNPTLSDEFITVVEDIHMRSRMLAMNFYGRSREAKDKYIESYLRNALAELQSDITKHNGSIVVRKLVLNYLSIYLAQTLGVDHHAATEEMYYILRKHEDFDSNLDHFVNKVMKELKGKN